MLKILHGRMLIALLAKKDLNYLLNHVHPLCAVDIISPADQYKCAQKNKNNLQINPNHILRFSTGGINTSFVISWTHIISQYKTLTCRATATETNLKSLMCLNQLCVDCLNFFLIYLPLLHS